MAPHSCFYAVQVKSLTVIDKTVSYEGLHLIPCTTLSVVLMLKIWTLLLLSCLNQSCVSCKSHSSVFFYHLHEYSKRILPRDLIVS